jgi:hypothetical protein
MLIIMTVATTRSYLTNNEDDVFRMMIIADKIDFVP